MDPELLTMSTKERSRLIKLEQVMRGEMTLAAAAEQMQVSLRQAVRLKARYATQGAAGLVHRARGRPGNRAADPALRAQAQALVAERYTDFGPTLAAEWLGRSHGLHVHRETLRRWLIAAGLWRPSAPPRRHRCARPRRARLGELVQIDGSDHAWLEERGPRGCLMVLTDDATGRRWAHLAPAETTQAAVAVLRQWIEREGVPAALYADRKSVYWSPAALEHKHLRGRREAHSEFGRVAHALGIELIAAYSPQAKGRVERTNGVLQDRLVKELRLAGACTIEQANACLEEFFARLNARFERTPGEAANAHRVFAPRDDEARELAFSIDYPRTVARDYTVALDGERWQIVRQPGLPAPGTRVTLWRAMDGRLRCQGPAGWLRIEPVVATAAPLRAACGW